ncbi:MAG: diguanylate cyclase domain-containing protein [Egibacteraceae bacterium]
MLFLDLDRVKQVNDAFGHEAGDRLLMRVATRLQSALRPVDTLARFGGDEFVILCEDLQLSADDLQVIGRRPFEHLGGANQACGSNGGCPRQHRDGATHRRRHRPGRPA